MIMVRIFKLYHTGANVYIQCETKCRIYLNVIPPNGTTGGVFIYKTMKGGHFHPASLRTGFFMPRKGDLQMADDKKNIPEAAPPAEAPASTVEKAAHGKGQGRQARQRPFSQGG